MVAKLLVTSISMKKLCQNKSRNLKNEAKKLTTTSPTEIKNTPVNNFSSHLANPYISSEKKRVYWSLHPLIFD